MCWQYRTILFEFQKDGLLGDKYIDDEAMEKTLNEQGEMGWELVGVTSVQEGILSFFKRSRQSAGPKINVPDTIPEGQAKTAAKQTLVTSAQLQQEEKECIHRLEQDRLRTMRKPERDMVDDIQIR